MRSAPNTKYLFSLFIVAFLIAVPIRMPGVTWLVGQGAVPEQSFNIDDNRFIVSAMNFQEHEAKPDGYPLFMTTQLYVFSKMMERVFKHHMNLAVLLRMISMVYAVGTILLTFAFCRVLGLRPAVALLASCFLAVAPMHVLLSHAGTPDISILFVLYLTILLAILHQRSGHPWLFFAVCALTGIAIADKFFLPAVVPLGLLIVTGVPRLVPQRIFLAGCIVLSFFTAASFFNYTPWDFMRLIRMIAYDNVVVAGGYGPATQLGLYSLDLVSSTGLITALLALPVVLLGLLRLGRRPARSNMPGGHREVWFSAPVQRVLLWLSTPAALIVLPLALNAVLIVMAQVHGMRHVLLFVPVVCVVAAIGVDRAVRLIAVPLAVRVGALAVLLLALTYNAYLTNQIYATDIRQRLASFLSVERAGSDATTLHFYSALKGVREVQQAQLSDLIVTCDLEYERYFKSDDATRIFHAVGGQERLQFYRDLFAGRTAYRPALTLTRNRFSLEDRLAALGWLPELGTFAPNQCRAFEREAVPPSLAAHPD